MTGEELRGLVEEEIEAGYPSLRYFHSYDSRRDRMPGWPDHAISGPGGFITAEYKGPAEELRPEQTIWKWSLIAAGVVWRLYRPVHWDTGVIRAELDRLAAR